jgi:hypothetical protein
MRCSGTTVSTAITDPWVAKKNPATCVDGVKWMVLDNRLYSTESGSKH